MSKVEEITRNYIKHYRKYAISPMDTRCSTDFFNYNSANFRRNGAVLVKKMQFAGKGVEKVRLSRLPVNPSIKKLNLSGFARRSSNFQNYLLLTFLDHPTSYYNARRLAVIVLLYWVRICKNCAGKKSAICICAINSVYCACACTEQLHRVIKCHWLLLNNLAAS